MRKTFLMALMAAVAVVPAVAQAQDDGDKGRAGWGGRGGDRGGDRPRFERHDNAPAPQPRPQADRSQFQAPSDRSQFRRPDGDRPAFQRPAFGGNSGTPPQAPATQAARPDGNGWRRPDGGPAGGWRGNRGGDRPEATPATRATPATPASPEWRDRTRGPGGWNGNRPDGWNRDRDGDRRPDGWTRDGDRRPDGWNRDRDNDRRPGGWNRDRDRNDGRWNGGQWSGNRDRYDRGRGWNRDWRQDRRWDYNHYRQTNRAIFRLPRYYAPYGWDYGYRRFSIGVRLWTGLFDRSYWIDDPYYYRLPPVDYPYQWVRYYNDALLVDVETGEVVDVIYDIFW